MVYCSFIISYGDMGVNVSRRNINYCFSPSSGTATHVDSFVGNIQSYESNTTRQSTRKGDSQPGW